MTTGNTHTNDNAGESKLTGYQLHKAWFSFALNNPEKVTPTQGILYLYCVELCNSLGWPKTFGLPATFAMAATGIKSYNTYAKTFRELVEFGAIKLITKSKNQYTANIIALSNFNKALGEALNEAPAEANNVTSTSAIIPYINNKLETTETFDRINRETIVSQHAPKELDIGDFKNDFLDGNIVTPIERETPLNGKSHKNNFKTEANEEEPPKGKNFKKPTVEEVRAYCEERNNGIDPQQWIDHYTANGWKVGKNPMKDWKAAVRTWERNGIDRGNTGGNYPGRTSSDENKPPAKKYIGTL